MSFPIGHPNRRIVQRSRFAEPCVVDIGRGHTVQGILRQLDPYGARVRLLQRIGSSIETIAIVTKDGTEIFGTTVWQSEDVVGIQRCTKSETILVRPTSV
ncbi:hypothetical protein [Brevundimonas subvibrioides]|uniref:hypothetical protein n=1 Tax=Brevundimonas subvibrioides TaxID=74313 RepID=UPI0022B35F0C|nr:hypothetical protein [Brevundimonas subvibrioides]